MTTVIDTLADWGLVGFSLEDYPVVWLSGYPTCGRLSKRRAAQRSLAAWENSTVLGFSGFERTGAMMNSMLSTSTALITEASSAIPLMVAKLELVVREEVVALRKRKSWAESVRRFVSCT